jgi:tRNA(fMet)-specific endonuclease VapC
VNRYLLDTNTCIEYLRRATPRLVSRIQSKRPREVRLCSVVLAELYHGAHRSADPLTNLKLVNELSETFISLAFDDRAAETYGQLRATLEATGSIIGPYDLQIAAIGLTRGLIVVTSNVGEFSRVPGLVVEDWLI